ncbi:hypothetical protein PIB30_085873 [Stylosanthes scabra]|uniref:Uncharacterized protein n=1 Tax=Stylosanthes scabra TaxID=79078 RepID=A0ABU6XS11_9FABA|nr:hypothetical protein [Stylosanthes scabra]
MASASLTTAAVAVRSEEKRESRVVFILRREGETELELERETLNENDPSLKRESTIEALSPSLDSPRTAPLLPRFTVAALLGFRTAALFPRSFATAAAECGCQSRCSASLSPMNCSKFCLVVF